jgi:hypothetical protein
MGQESRDKFLVREHWAFGPTRRPGGQGQHQAPIAVRKIPLDAGVVKGLEPLWPSLDAGNPVELAAGFDHDPSREKVSAQALFLGGAPPAVHWQDHSARARHRPEHEQVLNRVIERHPDDIARANS